METYPMWWPFGTSTTTASPVVKFSFSTFRKNSFRPFLKRTSSMLNLSSAGMSMLESQSNMFILLQPPVPHAPLLLQPAVLPFLSFVDPHEHPIVSYVL